MGDERGSATVLAAMAIVSLLTLTGAALHVGAAVIARHRAQAAADLAALSAASALPGGVQTACGYAVDVAQSMGATTTSCVVDGLDVVVTVESPAGLRLVGPARAVARAGPGGG